MYSINYVVNYVSNYFDQRCVSICYNPFYILRFFHP